MTTLYDVLGLTPDAKQADIKKAYRRESSKWHPDRNHGNAEAAAKMAAINEANDVLSDPDRRRRYDDTGDISKGPPSIEAMADKMVSRFFSMGLTQSPEGFLMNFIRASIDADREKAVAGRKEAEEMYAKLKRRQATIRVPDGVVNLAHDVINDQLQQCNDAIESCERVMLICARAHEVLKAYSYDEQMEGQALAARPFVSQAAASLGKQTGGGWGSFN